MGVTKRRGLFLCRLVLRDIIGMDRVRTAVHLVNQSELVIIQKKDSILPNTRLVELKEVSW